MKWVIDSTDRFEWRPYYEQAELDSECEGIVSNFLSSKNGTVQFPISTDDLTILIEADTSNLDLYADLSSAGEDVEGVTDFFTQKKPAVRIARELSLDNSRYHRLRTTLAHEYAHVRFHSFLWEYNCLKPSVLKMSKKLVHQSHRYHQLLRTFSRAPDLKSVPPGVTPHSIAHSNFRSGSCFSCARDLILDAPFSDWMEWQASYVCGALLMPISLLQNLVQKSLTGHNESQWVPDNSDMAAKLINNTAETFDVSADAARVRLRKLGFLQSRS
jgi:Zn-dependent peptidase ImmA (M78 family)